MKKLFVGKPLHWLLIAVVIAVLYWLGSIQLHRLNYTVFLFALLGLAVASIAVVIVTTRRGEQVTREPFEDDAA